LSDRNDTPVDQADSLTDMAVLTERLRLAIAAINELDPQWPHSRVPGEAAFCRYCVGEMPQHTHDCPAKLILGA
jgi:hypothetical protein